MKILYGVIGAFMVGFSFFILKTPPAHPNPFLLLIPAVILAGAVLIFINLVKRRVIISDTGITNINVFTNKTLAFSDIKGCRIGQKFITLEPVSETSKIIVIGNYIDLGDSEELAGWIKANFKDVDAEDFENEQNALLQDSALGATAEARKGSLAIAKQVAMGYGAGGWICLGLMFFYDSKWSLILNLIYPLFSGMVMLWSKGLIKFFASPKRSIYPSLFYGFMPSGIALIAIAAAKYTFFDFDTLWVPAIIVSIIMFVMLYFADKIRIVEPLKGKVFLISFMALAYGFGAIMQVDCAFDNSAPTIYVARVLSEHIESGKHTSYVFTLSEWGPMHKEKEEDVGKWIYDNVPIGDSVRIYFRSGKLHAPWYQVHSFAYKGQ